MGCRNTVLKGILPQSITDIMAILATQKNKISAPVSRMVFGKKAFKSKLSMFGHPKAEKGNKAEENQVSKTSSS
jgi:hypothetical protein